MTNLDKENIQTAEILLPCNNLDETLQFFTDKLGFKMETIAPAEEPSLAVISGYGIRLRLEPGNNQDPGSINLLCSEPASVADGKLQLTAPNGTIVNLIEANPSLNIQKVKQTFLLTKMKTSDQWSEGQAICGRSNANIPSLKTFHPPWFPFCFGSFMSNKMLSVK